MDDTDTGDATENRAPQERVPVRRTAWTREIIAGIEGGTGGRPTLIASLVISVPLSEIALAHRTLVGRLVRAKLHQSAQTTLLRRAHNGGRMLMMMMRTCCLERRS